MTNVQCFTPTNNPQVPDALKEFPNFVVWRLIPNANGGKPKKLLFDPKTYQVASSTNPNTWSNYETACLALRNGGFNGIGFVFTENDPFVFLDIDDCRDPATGAVTQAAQFFLNTCPTAAWEVSQSYKGLHAIMRVSNKKDLYDRKNKFLLLDGKFEFYTTKRFIAFGQCNWWGDLALKENLDIHLKNLIPTKAIETEQPISTVQNTSSHEDILQRAMKTKSIAQIFEKTPDFESLWNGNSDILSKFYPDSGDRKFDHSSAEQALANILMFHSNGDGGAVCLLMNNSPLCQRIKWKTRADYRTRTIKKAEIAFHEYQKKRRSEQQSKNEIIGNDTPSLPLPTILDLEGMLEQFVHVGNGSQIIHRPTKRVRAKDDAALEYAGSYCEVDTGKFDNNGLPVRKRCKNIRLWQESSHRLSVDEYTWQPDKPEFCSALELSTNGGNAYNLWRGLSFLPPPGNWQEWAQPFLQHVTYLVPNEVERLRFLQWLAHIFQRPGELPHTAYLFIATMTGIGRNTLASILARALRGYVAANIDVQILTNKGFNGRLSQKLLATVDEIREGGGNRWQQAENIKSALTEEHRNINPKFGRQYLEKNCCRFLMFSNHLDALPFDEMDRRIIVIENPTVPANPGWFEYIHSVMDNPNFIASVQYYLLNFDISNFKTGERAPMNQAKIKALAAMESNAEKSVRQFVDEWPGSLSTVADLREFIGEDALSLSSKAISHLIDRAKMQTAHRISIASKKETILIVKGTLTADDLKERVSNEVIDREIREARLKFRTTTR